ncbi:MAG: DNA/RNA non-specific endonuclease [Alistipes sp.]|nr:DNA/RNA non-specific endonuclease [Alistipes sp.]
MKRLSLLLLPFLAVSSCEGNDPASSAPSRPDFEIQEAVPGDRSVVLTARIVPTSDHAVEQAGFAYKPEGPGDYTEVAAAYDERTASATLTGLAPETEYRWYSYAVVAGIRFDAPLSQTFRTPAAGEVPAPQPEPLFGTPRAVDITQTAATLTAELSYDAQAADYTVGFAWKRNDATESLEEVPVPAGSGTKSVRIEALTPATEYTFYLYADREGERFRSEEAVFTTGDDSTTPSGGIYRTGWAELPREVEKAGDYYYAYHMRPDDVPGRNYSVCYSAEMRCAVWAAMPLHECYLGSAKRTNAWQYDPAIPQEVQPNLKQAYVGNYSRGHMVASSDRQVDQTINRTTFYYTNMAPQIQNEFNGGIWNDLEVKCQKNWVCSDTLYVVTGAYFENENRTCEDINGQRVVVPTHFYKVLLRSKSGNTGKPLHELAADEMICTGFWLDHTSKYGTKDKITAEYMMPVAEIERKTGFEFFTNVAAAPKERCTAADWGL